MKQITVLKGVQIGYSKTLKAIYAYVISYLNKRCSVVFPTKDNVKRFWKDEIVDMYRSVKALKKLIRDIERGGAANTMSEQRFINGAIGYFRSAFKEDDLQSFTCEINMADEVDREGWQPRAGSAGNKLNQLRNRGVDLKGSKLLVGSTPGLRHTSVIWAEWLLSDQRRLRVNCPIAEPSRSFDGAAEILATASNTSATTTTGLSTRSTSATARNSAGSIKTTEMKWSMPAGMFRQRWRRNLAT